MSIDFMWPVVVAGDRPIIKDKEGQPYFVDDNYSIWALDALRQWVGKRSMVEARSAHRAKFGERVIPGEGPYQVGTFWNFRWNDQHNRLEADFEPLGEALQETLETRWMRGELESVGVSLSAQCVTRGGIIVDRIEHMDYIDLVPRGALGGRFLPLGVAQEALLLLRQPGEFADRDHRDRLRAYASVQRTLREIWNQKRPARVGGRAGGRLNRPIR